MEVVGEVAAPRPLVEAVQVGPDVVFAEPAGEAAGVERLAAEVVPGRLLELVERFEQALRL